MSNTVRPIFGASLQRNSKGWHAEALTVCAPQSRRKTTHTTLRRFAVAALAGVIAYSAISLSPAEARHWRRGDAAVLGAVAGIFGTIAVLAARDRYRDDYYGCYGCGGPSYGYYQRPCGQCAGLWLSRLAPSLALDVRNASSTMIDLRRLLTLVNRLEAPVMYSPPHD